MRNIYEIMEALNKDIGKDIDTFKKGYNKSVKAYNSTQGHIKHWNSFLEIVINDDFLKAIDKLRIKFNIPKAGFKTRNRLIDSYRLYKYHSLFPFKPEDGVKKLKEFTEEIGKLCKKYHLHCVEWARTIEIYLIYNKIEQPSDYNSHNLCLVCDLVADKAAAGLEKIRSLGMTGEFEKYDDFTYPIAIKISPYAGENDIVDYIKKIYTLEIKPRQERYRDKNCKIGKIKSKNQLIQKRNQFIYQNRDKTGKEIKQLVIEKFGKDLPKYLPYEYISKIIYKENKKRQKL